MKHKKIEGELHFVIEYSFYEYSTRAKNEKAERDIQRYIKRVLRDECSYVPIMVQKGEEGGSEEDIAQAKATLELVIER